MKRFPYLLLALFLFAACEKTSTPTEDDPALETGLGPEESPEFIWIGASYVDISYLWVNILDAEGNDVLIDYPVQNLPLSAYEVDRDNSTVWQPVRFFRGSRALRIRTDRIDPCDDESPQVTYRICSQALFHDDLMHEVIYDTARESYEDTHFDHFHRATSLTFDGQSIAPDADGVFVIRLPKKE